MKPKLLFVYDLKREDLWHDGLWAAIELLKQDFEIKYWNVRDNVQQPAFTPDFILGWGAFNSGIDKYLSTYNDTSYRAFDSKHTPIGLCIGGNAFPPRGAENYDVLFYETNWYKNQIKDHKNIVHAFGVNTAIYRRRTIERRLYDWIGVGSFSLWKRWEYMTGKAGLKLVVGEYQKENRQESNQIVDYLVANGVMVSDMVAPEDLALMYNHAARCYIPADINGGGERAVLEARACGIKVEVEKDNLKLQELAVGPVWDEKYYYQQLKKGILSCLA